MKDRTRRAGFEWAQASLELAIRRARRDEQRLLDELETRVAELELAWRDAAVPEVFSRFGLNPTEQALAYLLCGIATCTAARAFADAIGGDPTTATLATLHGSASAGDRLAALDASLVLRRLRIIERTDRNERHESRFTWGIAPRIVRALFGTLELDGSLSGVATLGNARAETDLVGSMPSGVEHALRVRCGVVVLSGSQGAGRRSLARAAASSAGLQLVEIDVGRLERDPAHLVDQLKLLARECKLLGRAPLIRNIDALVDADGQTRVDLVGSELVAELDGPVFVTCGPNRPAMRWGRPLTVIDVKPPTSAQRARLWLDKLGQGTPEDGEHLATMYPLAPALIHHAAEAAKARAGARPIQPDDIAHGVRAVLDDRLGDYAKRVEVTQSWDDVVLPDEHLEALKYLIARVRQRHTVYEQWGFAAKVGKGLGTSALFSGPPGTGKTMVAALVAKELGLELYQVDMAKLVSKFIGETERNLAALFDVAEAGHAVLLFDECDSLFGKRTEVKSSNDRYANLETNYLLQRLESFTGICLLTSNHESNIDPAFQRRLSLHLRFELPDADERARLWRAVLPVAAPVADDLDIDGLARRFVMSGGYVRNAALRAAFMAADEGRAICVSHLERAARLEYEAMGKIVDGVCD